jgi:hypothetical protein
VEAVDVVEHAVVGLRHDRQRPGDRRIALHEPLDCFNGTTYFFPFL